MKTRRYFENEREESGPEEGNEEEWLDSDLSSGEYEVSKTPTKMELGSDVYKVHETIDLEWPTQTVCLSNKENNILIGTCPGTPFGKPEIFELEGVPSLTSPKKLEKRSSQRTMPSVNRIRRDSHTIYTISDKSLCLYDNSLQLIEKNSIAGGYAIAIRGESLFYGDGSKLVLRANTKTEGEIESGSKEIFSVAPLDEKTAAVATRNIALVDFRSKEQTSLYKGKQDINSVAYNEDNLLVCGMDTGVLYILDIRSPGKVEKIDFHKSPVTHVLFSGRETFASSSDCEVALWDMSFTEEWEFHKYLSFVHQGQTYYKEFQFLSPETVITTAQEGLCVFQPKTEEEDMCGEQMGS